MNYIKRLIETNKAQEEAIKRTDNEINNFIAFLGTEKFTGTQADGSRKDWISTADVINRLQEMRRTLTGEL